MNEKEENKPETIDGVNDCYKFSNVTANIKQVLIVCNVIFVIVVFFSSGLINLIFSWMLIVIAIVIPILGGISNLYLYNADRIRRKENLQNGFGADLVNEKTENYYNNDVSQSDAKWALNTLESNFFTKSIAGKMIPSKAILSIIAFMTLIVVLIAENEVQSISTISQTIFSTNLFADFVSLLIFKIKTERLYEEGRKLLITQREKEEYLLIDYGMEYHCLVAYSKVRLNSRIYKKYNEALSAEWEKIIKKRQS